MLLTGGSKVHPAHIEIVFCLYYYCAFGESQLDLRRHVPCPGSPQMLEEFKSAMCF